MFKLTPSVCLLAALWVTFVLTGCNTNSDKGKSPSSEFAHSSSHRGLTGPGQSRTHGSRPPMQPEAWGVMDGYVFEGEQIGWGDKARPSAVFQVPGGIGLIYNSRPPAEYELNPPQGHASQQHGSLAFTRNLVDWYDYPGNPIFSEIQYWQGPYRAQARTMLYDEANSQWVIYFGDREGNYDGIRAIGAAFSYDLMNWRFHDGPIITILDYLKAVPEQIEATLDELKEDGRVYSNWALFDDGKYYLGIDGTNITGAGRVYGNIIFVSDQPGGPFVYAPVAGDFVPESLPVYSDGYWYTIYRGEWDGELGFGLAWSKNLLGPYTRNPLNPIITIEIDSMLRTQPQLLRYDGIWAVLFSHQYTGRDFRLRLATANIMPDMILRDNSTFGSR